MKRATLRLLLATAAVLAAAAPAAAQAGEDPTPGNGKKVDHVALLRQAIGGRRWVGVWLLNEKLAATAATARHCRPPRVPLVHAVLAALTWLPS